MVCPVGLRNVMPSAELLSFALGSSKTRVSWGARMVLSVSSRLGVLSSSHSCQPVKSTGSRSGLWSSIHSGWPVAGAGWSSVRMGAAEMVAGVISKLKNNKVRQKNKFEIIMHQVYRRTRYKNCSVLNVTKPIEAINSQRPAKSNNCA